MAKILNRLANMKGRAGSVDKAMVLFDESLRIRMLHLGNNHEGKLQIDPFVRSTPFRRKNPLTMLLECLSW